MSGNPQIELIIEQIAQAIREETDDHAVTISSTTTAADVAGWDSVAHARIMLNVEARLGVPVDLSATFEAKDVGELARMIAESQR